MFKVNDDVMIKSSGTVGVVRSVADNGDVVIQTVNGTYGYTKSNAVKYLALNLQKVKCDCLTRETVVLRNVITTRTLKDMQDMIGPARAAMDFNVRATGRSSGIALAWLAACIEAPYIWHKATDHPVDGKRATMYMNEELFRLAQRIIAVLEWRGWEYHKTDGIRFVPIVKETTKYEPTTIVTSLR